MMCSEMETVSACVGLCCCGIVQRVHVRLTPTDSMGGVSLTVCVTRSFEFNAWLSCSRS
jgi:hypothetical protein